MGHWYSESLPRIKDVLPHLADISRQVSKINGVIKVCFMGSVVEKESQPNYPVRDINVIAVTNFDEGDLLAIHDGPMSPLNISPTEWEDYGFNPEAIKFSKAYTAIQGIDHWTASDNGTLLHWGRMPDNLKEWKDIHEEAETFASETTGYNRQKIAKKKEEEKIHWHQAYLHSVQKTFGNQKMTAGWFSSDHKLNEIINRTKQIL